MGRGGGVNIVSKHALRLMCMLSKTCTTNPQTGYKFDAGYSQTYFSFVKWHNLNFVCAFPGKTTYLSESAPIDILFTSR